MNGNYALDKKKGLATNKPIGGKNGLVANILVGIKNKKTSREKRQNNG